MRSRGPNVVSCPVEAGDPMSGGQLASGRPDRAQSVTVQPVPDCVRVHAQLAGDLYERPHSLGQAVGQVPGCFTNWGYRLPPPRSVTVSVGQAPLPRGAKLSTCSV